MSEVRDALLELLRSPHDTARKQVLVQRVGGLQLADARSVAKDHPASVDAAAKVLARMVLDALPTADIVDAAKAASSRAPRDEKGDDIALLAGAVLWRLAEQPQLAEPFFRRVRRNDAAHPEVLAFYRDLFTGEAGAGQLMQVLVQARRGLKNPDKRFALAEEMAHLAQERLGSADRAIEVWRSVLREDGHDPRAIAALERLYRSGEKWTALVELLKEELDRIPATPDTMQARITKLLEISELYRDRLRLDTMSLATLQRILDIDPRHEPSLDRLADTYAKAGRWNDLLSVFDRRLEAARQADDGARQVDILHQVARIWMEHLGNPQRALDPLRRLLELDGKDTEARRLLASIHGQRRDWRALIALRREELSDMPAEAANALRIELARMAEERLGDRREAIQAWNEVVEHHGESEEPLAALARLYERESRWLEASEAVRRQAAWAAKTGDHESTIRFLLQLGAIYVDRLRDREAGLPIWQEIVRLAPGHDKATRMLRDTYVSTGRWDDLTDLYVAQDRVADLVEVLQSAADRVQDVDERVGLYRRIATVCRERLGQPERAVKSLERMAALQPDNYEVARELVPIYREQANWARLMGTYEVLLAAATDDDERLEIIASMREVAEHKLASPSLTLQSAVRAYQIRPSSSALRDDLEVAAERADGWDQVTRIFDARTNDAAVDEHERLLLLDKLAVLARDKLFKPDDAQRYFRRIIALDPNNQGAMEALEEIYSSTRRWDDLTDVYRRRLEVTSDAEARLSTLRGLATIQEQQLRDLDGAVSSYKAMLELAPSDVGTLESLARIYRNRGDWQELAAVLMQQLELADGGKASVPVRFELAQLQATRLRDSAAAIAGCLAVLELEPLHRGAVEVLEQVKESEPSTVLTVMRGLLPYYRRVSDRPKEAGAMEVLVAAEDDDAKRLDLLEQLAGTYEKMIERQADALRIRRQIFVAQPIGWQNRQILKRLARELGHIEDVAVAYREVLDVVAARAKEAEQEGRTPTREESSLRRDLLLEYAAILRDDLERASDAERAFREVLEFDETHQGAYESLEALLRVRGANEELVRLYRRRVDVIFNQREQRDLLSRIIKLSRTVLRDRATAIATAEELLDLMPDDLATIELLAGMYHEGSERHDREQLEQLLGRWSELVQDPVQGRELACRRAALRIQDLGDAFGAVDLLGQVLGEDPDHVEARRLLEELLDIHEVQLQVCGLLEPIYQRLGYHRGRIRVLHTRRAEAERAGNLDQAVTHLLQVARIEEKDLGERELAFSSIQDAFSIDPLRLDTRTEVERLGLALGKESELVRIWQGVLGREQLVDATLRIELTHRIAVLYDERLHDTEAARDWYTRLLELDPPDARLAQKAVEALVRLHVEAGDSMALIAAKNALLRFTDTVREQVRIRLEIAEIHEEHLGDRVEAALTYSEVLDMQPDNLRAIEALERLFLEEGEWERLCEVLLHRLSVIPDPRHRAVVWRRIGEIRQSELGDPQGAVHAYQSILDLKVGREDTAHALRALVELNDQLQRFADVEEGLKKLIALADNDRDRTELLLRCGFVVGEKLGRGADALESLKRVLDLAPKDERAREMVAGYLDHDELRERATRILAPLYEAEQNWVALLGLEELQARHQPSGRRRLQALLQVARTHEERLDDPAKAFTVLCEAMGEAADQPELAEILVKVMRLGAAPERAEATLAAYLATVDRILDADLQQRVLRQMGDIALNRLGRMDEARRAYERLLELAPEDDEACDALEQVYLRVDDHPALAALLETRAERATGAVRDSYLIRAAELQRTKLGSAEEAIGLYERLSSAALATAEVQDVLEPLYEGTERHRELALHLNRKLSRLSGRALVDTHLRLGQLYGGPLNDAESGIRHLAAALRLDPDHTVATDGLRRYLEDEGMRARAAEMLEPVFAAVQDWPRLIQIQEIRLAEADSPQARVQILLRIALIEEEQLEDLERAFDSYVRLFDEDPLNQHVRDQLHRLSNVLRRHDVFAQMLTDHAEKAAGDDGDEVLAVVREAADLWARQLRSPAKAVPLYQRILAARPGQVEVFTALESALTQAESWRELTEAYWREAEASAEETRQIELLRRLATVAADMVEDLNESARAYQRILEIRPDHEAARTRLEQLFERTGRHADMLDLLRDRLARTERVDVRTHVHLRIADLQDGLLDDGEGALDTLEALLEEVPGQPQALAALERIGQARAGLRPRLVAILRPFYQRTREADRLIMLCEWQLGSTTDASARHEIFREIARLHEQVLGDSDSAFRVLCRALQEPGTTDVLQELDRELEHLARRLRTPLALAEALVVAAESESMVSDIERRMELFVRAARLQLEAGNVPIAVEILRRALAVSPDHADALSLMDVALVRTEAHAELKGVLSRRVSVAHDDEERAELLRRLARLLEETLAEPEEAERTWHDVLDVVANDHEALRRLTAIFERREAIDELIDILRRRIDSTRDDAERRELRMQLASLLRDRRDDRTAQIDILRDLLLDVPADRMALSELTDALLVEHRFAEAVDVLHERASVSDDVREKADLWLDIARLDVRELDDLTAAIEHYEQVLGWVPGHAGALEDLIALALKPASSEAATAVVVPELERHERYADLDRVLDARAAQTLDLDERARLLDKLASIRQQHTGDLAGALRSRMSLLECVSTEGLPVVLEQAARLAVELGTVEAHVEALATRSRSEDLEPRARVLIARAGAKLAEEVLRDAARALSLLEPMLRAGFADRALCERMEGLAGAAQDNEMMTEVLAALVDLCDLPSDRADVLCRLGAVQAERKEYPRAIDAYRDALDQQPGMALAIAGLERVLAAFDEPLPAVLDALESAYQAAGDKPGLAHIVRARIAVAADADRSLLLERLASLCEEGGGTKEEAVDAWGLFLQRDPENVHALERVVALGREQGLLRRGAELMLLAIENARQDGRSVVPLWMATASVLLRDLSDAAHALGPIRAVLEEQPDHPEALELWIEAARRSADAQMLHDALVHSAAAQIVPEAAVHQWREAAQVAELELGNRERAIEDLEQLIAVDEGNEQAWEKLLALRSAMNDHEGLAAALARRVVVTADPSERRSLRARLASLLTVNLRRNDDAIVVYQDMIGDQPDDIGALQELEALLRELERWQDVREVLERRLNVASESERVTVLEEIARVSEHRLQDPMDAIERYQRVLVDRPDQESARAALERLLEQEERWQDLADLLERRMDRLTSGGDPEALRTVASRLAELLAERLEDTERAQAILKQLLDIDPGYVPAILALASVYEARGDEGAMRLALQRAIEQQPQGKIGAQVELRLARLAGDDSQRRREHLERALACDTSNREVANALLDLSRKDAQWDRVAYLLELAATREQDAAERQKLTLERVDVMLEHLGDVEGALVVLAAVYEQVQDDMGVNRRIADALFQAQRYEEAAGMYNWLVEVGRRSKRSKVLAHHLTRLARIELQQPQSDVAAREHLIEAYRLDTTNVETLITLASLHERASEWKEALKIYRAMLLQNADQSGLVRRGDLYLSLARVHVALDEKSKALAMLRRGVEEDGSHPELVPTLEQLERT